MEVKLTKENFKEQQDAALSVLFEKHKLFFAFSNEQFAKGMAKYPEVPKADWKPFFGGGYCPNPKLLAKEMNVHMEKWLEKEKELKSKKEIILYHLYNHESFYTWDLTDAINLSSDYGYTKEEVWKVFREEQDRIAKED